MNNSDNKKGMKKALSFSVAGVTLAATVFGASHVFAASTSNFRQVINPGTLTVDIVDGSYVSVANPAVTFGAVTFSFACQTSTGTFGTATEQIYVQNPDAADNGWTVSLAASSGATAFWDGTSADFDFNDPTGTPAGCADGADTDSLAGQMTIDASGGTLAAGNCASCTTANITLGSSAAYNEGTLDSITLLTAAAASDDIGDFTLQDVDVSQQIPPEQPADSTYNIDMTLSIVAS